MNNAFTGSARYYDLIYSKKDYFREVVLLDRIIKKHLTIKNPAVLDIGCGTGKHLVEFHKKKYVCSGIDISENMLAIAEKRLKELTPKPDLLRGDIRFFNLNRKFDVVCSLFHVTSYLLSNRDLIRAFSNARKHLKKEGLFLFDFWYKPGVIYQKPKLTFQYYRKKPLTVYRIKLPQSRRNQNIVDVRHLIFASDNGGNYKKFEETHSMRCFEADEIKNFLGKTGFRIIEKGKLDDSLKIPDSRSWDAFVIAKAI